MTILDAIILGLVEGITEYLPVSSTGHLIIASWLLGLLDDPARKPAIDSFNVIIQGGAILAVLGLYWPRVQLMLKGLVGRDANGLALFAKLVVAFLPAAVLGVLIDDWIEERLFRPVPVLMALGGGGLLLLILAPWIKTLVKREAGERDDFAQLTMLHAFAIGCMQCIAMWPGTSRSMMTILGGILFGLSPRRAAEFSFLLGLPTLGGACVYKLAKAGRDDPAAFIASLGGPVPPAVGIVVAAFSAALAIKWLVGYLSKGGMAVFGWWRVAVAIALGAAIFGGHVTL
ncbi:MAG: undecaprenyl-diphosphate phosphatase [Phycisphaera sp.]|nr:undecaprenyl-diphosphate phosphatase [Phycisphaera sp.]